MNLADAALQAKIDTLTSQTTTNISTAKSEAISSAGIYTDAEVSNLRDEMQTTDAALISAMSEEDASIRTDMQTTNQALQSVIDTHKSDVDAEFEVLRSEIENASNASVEYVDTEIGELIAVDEVHTSNIAQNAADIDALEANNQTHTEQIAAVQNRLGQLENTVNSMLTIDDVKALIAEQLLTAPNGSQYKLCVDNSGVLSAMLVFEADSGENSEEEEVNPDEPNPAS